MEKKRFLLAICIQLVCWIIIGLLGFTNLPKPAQASPLTDTFLGPVFYGAKPVLKIFDHNLPLWVTVFGNDGNNITLHYDGNQYSDDNSNYGYDQHTGIDYDLHYEPVLAAASGTVNQAGWAEPDNHRNSYGLHVRINHNNGYQSLYGHLSSLAVTFGQEITVDPSDPGNRQAIIGISGNTGVVRGGGACPAVEVDPTCGQHLHFELRNGARRPVNPYGWNSENTTTTPDPWANYNPTTTPIHPTPLSTLTPPIPETPGTPKFLGAISENVWLNYPANSDPNAQYPTGTPVATPVPLEAYITVDNADANYSENRENQPSPCTQPETGGYNGDYRFMPIIEFGPPSTPVPDSTCLARWTLTPPNGSTPDDDGYYEVYVHIPVTVTHTFSRGGGLFNQASSSE